MGRSWASTEGLPFPLGVSWIEEERAFNFALYSNHAETVTLLLYQEDDQDQPCYLAGAPIPHQQIRPRLALPAR